MPALQVLENLWAGIFPAAETLLKRGLAALKMTEEEAGGLKQNEVRKQALAWLIKKHTVRGKAGFAIVWEWEIEATQAERWECFAALRAIG